MELQLNALTVPAVGWNKEEFKAAIVAINDRYANTVVVDKGLAKKDRATINKALKAVDDARKSVKKKLLAPYEAFEAELNEVMAPLRETAAAIDTQIKAIEEQERNDKLNAIGEMFEGMSKPDGLELGTIFKSSWLNASTSMKQVGTEIEEAIKGIEDRVNMARNMRSECNDELVRMALTGASADEIIAKNEEISRITATLNVPKAPADVAAELAQENPRNTYTVTDAGIEIAAKVTEHKMTVMCSAGRWDVLLRWLDDNGYFYMTEE